MATSRSAWVIAACLGAALGLGWSLDRAEFNAPLRDVLQERSISAPMLRLGNVGDILRDAGLVLPDANDGRFTPRSKGEPGTDWDVLRKRRTRGSGLLRANPGGALASTTAVLPEHHIAGIPTISIWVDEGDLYDEQHGIVPNFEETWERPAQVSYFEDGVLKFATDCGIRLHGGTTRVPRIMEERGLEWRSFKLYFRPEYGVDLAPPGLLVDEQAGSIKTLIVRGNHFMNTALAFDIGRRVGNLAPHVRPARLVLNGQPVHTYSLIDHIGSRQWRQRLGHEDFELVKVFVSPETSKHASQLPYNNLLKTIQQMAPESVREEAEALVDLDDFKRHMFTLMFTAPADWGEGSCFLDRTSDDPKWRWVHWDLDNAFRVVHGTLIDEGDVEPWEKGFLDLVLKPFVKAERQARTILFQKLVENDAAFREELAHLVQDLLNHEVTVEFVLGRIEAYEAAGASERSRKDPLRRWKTFARKRPAFVRGDIARQFGLEPAKHMTLRANGDAELVVDGRRVRAPYQGWYFPLFPAELSVPPELAPRFSHWLVDGERVDGLTLRPSMVGDSTAVRAVFGK